MTHFIKKGLVRFLVTLIFLQFAHSALTSDQIFELQAEQGFNGVIYLDPTNFESVMNGPRDYYLSLLFTALDPSVNCEYCQKFQPHYENVARSYHTTNPGKDAIFFFIAEFPENKELFGKLNINAVPLLRIFPPNMTETADVFSPHFAYSIGERALNTPLDFGEYVSKITGANIVLNSEFDISQFAMYFVGTFIVVLALKKKVLSKLGRGIILRNLITLLTVVLISGYMFTVIRGIPFIAKNEHNEVMYFSGGTHWQFGLETLTISTIYLLLVTLIYALVIKIPMVENDSRRNTLTICTSFAIFYVFNCLTGIFKIKDPEYPYQLTSWI